MVHPAVHLPTLLARLYSSGRTLEQRKRTGQFFTSASVAKWALSMEPPESNDRICDAGAGAAVFADTVVRMGLPVRSYLGVENDPILALCAAHVLEALDAPSEFKVWYANFLTLQATTFKTRGHSLPTYIISNPPFVRFHNLSGRARILASVRTSLGVTLSPLSGSGSYFLSRAAALSACADPSPVMTKTRCRLLFFFPQEVAGAAHARQLRNDLQRMHEWTPKERAIPAGQTGIDKHRSNTLALFFVFERKKSLAAPRAERLPPQPCLGDFLQIRRGISTGRNEFFVLTDAAVRERHIPKHRLQPVLPTRISLPSRRLSKDDWEGLRRGGHRCWLLALPNRDPKEFEVSVQEYLKEGVRRGLHTTPTGRGYKNWFSIPIPARPPDLFVTYLFRGAPRFVINDARVLHLTNILGCRFTAPVDDCRQQERIVDALNSQAKRWMEMDLIGREYKGGLRKIEPRELALLPLDPQLVRLAVTDSRSTLQGSFAI